MGLNACLLQLAHASTKQVAYHYPILPGLLHLLLTPIEYLIVLIEFNITCSVLLIMISSYHQPPLFE